VLRVLAHHGTEAHLSARRDGAGADDSDLEGLTVADTKAIAKVEQKQERKQTKFLFLAVTG